MAPTRSYWLDLFTGKTWQEFLDHGGMVSGFRMRRWKSVQRIQVGDYLLCYLTGIMRFVGILEVTSAPFMDHTPIWEQDVFPCRLKVRLDTRLTPETGVPVQSLSEHLSFFQHLKSPRAWTGVFRGSPFRFKASDGEIIAQAIVEAKTNPVVRPVDLAKLRRRPKTLTAKRIGPVTVPESEAPGEEALPGRAHDRIQLVLLKLGSGMGLDVWVARNDKGRAVSGQKLKELEGLRQKLPRQFDEATQKTIELIDVLWLRGSEIVAAFEIESTTSIYSGLLRMSDLLAMQPNSKIPLYLVAPADRREKVIAEVNRPTFSRLSPPLSRVCRFIPFSSLTDRLPEPNVIRYLKPEFLEELSESCEIEGG